MRHRKSGRQLGRNTGHRWALFRSLATSLIKQERIETTAAKAKEIRSFADEMISLGKRGDLHARRQALSFLRDPDVVEKLFSTIAPRFTHRSGGYTRIIRSRTRWGDGAEMAIVELVELTAPEKKGEKKKPVSAA